MKKTYNLTLILIVLVFASLSSAISVHAYDTISNTSKTHAEKKNGWVRKDGHVLYVRNGIKLKNCVTKIGKYLYAFNKKGYSIRSKSVFYKGYSYVFNSHGRAVLKKKAGYKKTVFYCYDPYSGKFQYAYQDLMLLEKCSTDPNDLEWLGLNMNYTAYHMVVPFTNTKVYNLKGDKLSVSQVRNKVKNGLNVRVYYDGSAAESLPGIFGKVYKIVFL